MIRLLLLIALLIQPYPGDPIPVKPIDIPFVCDITPNMPNCNEFWIMVNTSENKLYAFQGNALLREFIVSTGKKSTPTKTGNFIVYSMYKSFNFWGRGYHALNVKWTMFYHNDFAIHAAYWHNDFGTSVSHGCVNMREEDAEWVYQHVIKFHTSVIVI